MRTTMEDIARECGITKMTVSRVLSGGSNVKAATRKKVLSAATRLNYEINALAQNLNLNRSGYLGVATPFEGLLGSPYFGEVFRGFNRVLAASDLDFALFDTNAEAFNDGKKLARLYRQRRVDGLLVVAAHTTDRFIDTLEHLHVPMVVVGEQPRVAGVCSVECKNARGIELVCQHLYELGHRQIAFVEGPRDFVTAIRRKQAYLDFCHSRDLELPTSFVQPGGFDMHSGRNAGTILLKAKRRPTAVIAANDMMAFGVIEAARSLGFNVPEDVSVAGFDDLPTAMDRFPSLTTIHQPVCEMGEIGAKLLLDALETDILPTSQTTLEVSLIVRESTTAPRR